MTPYGAGYPQPPQPPYGAGAEGAPPAPAGAMSNPFGMSAGGGGAGANVISSPFGVPGASPTSGVAPPTTAFGSGMAPPPTGPGVLAPPPMGSMSSAPQCAPPPTAGAGVGAPPMGPPPTASTGAFPGSITAPLYPGADPAMATGGLQPGLQQQQQQQQRGNDAYTKAVLDEVAQFNAPGHFVRSTVGRLPNSISTKQKANVPLGFLIQPLAPIPPDGEEVPMVNFAKWGPSSGARHAGRT